MTDPFVDWIKRARTDKGETVSGRMVETRSRKTSEERKKPLEVEVNTDHAMNDNQEVWRVNLLRWNKAMILPLPPGHWIERRCRNCPTSQLK